MLKLRVLIADDHALILAGIQSLLERDHDVVAAVGDGHQAVEAALQHRPDLAVLDVSMPLVNGFEAAGRIQVALPSTAIIFLSMHNHPMYLRRALELGARGYVLKSGALEELPTAIRMVWEGKTYLSPSIESNVASETQPESSDLLTSRQREILQWIADGLASKEIAYRAGISIKTVDFHRARIMSRLGANSVGHLIRIAIERGLITASDL